MLLRLWSYVFYVKSIGLKIQKVVSSFGQMINGDYTHCMLSRSKEKSHHKWSIIMGNYNINVIKKRTRNNDELASKDS